VYLGTVEPLVDRFMIVWLVHWLIFAFCSGNTY
jgi:hypothetical protein